MTGSANLRGLTIRQPWASLIAGGHKRVETRSWSTKHRGVVAIHAGLGFPKLERQLAETERALGRLPARIPRGAIVAVARVAKVIDAIEAASQVSALERHLGDFRAGRHAWFLEDVRVLEEPIPCKGALSLWRIPDDVHLQLATAATVPVGSE